MILYVCDTLFKEYIHTYIMDDKLINYFCFKKIVSLRTFEKNRKFISNNTIFLEHKIFRYILMIL